MNPKLGAEILWGFADAEIILVPAKQEPHLRATGWDESSTMDRAWDTGSSADNELKTSPKQPQNALMNFLKCPKPSPNALMNLLKCPQKPIKTDPEWTPGILPEKTQKPTPENRPCPAGQLPKPSKIGTAPPPKPSPIIPGSLREVLNEAPTRGAFVTFTDLRHPHLGPRPKSPILPLMHPGVALDVADNRPSAGGHAPASFGVLRVRAEGSRSSGFQTLDNPK